MPQKEFCIGGMKTDDSTGLVDRCHRHGHPRRVPGYKEGVQSGKKLPKIVYVGGLKPVTRTPPLFRREVPPPGPEMGSPPHPRTCVMTNLHPSPLEMHSQMCLSAGQSPCKRRRSVQPKSGPVGLGDAGLLTPYSRSPACSVAVLLCVCPKFRATWLLFSVLFFDNSFSTF